MSEEMNTSSSEGMSDSQLQSQMSDNLSEAWLDPSVNAYQDGRGNLLEINGEWVRTPEQLAKYKEQNKTTQNATNQNAAVQPTEQQNVNQNAQQQQPKTSKAFEKFRDFKYTPPVQQKAVPQPDQQQTQQKQEPAKKDVQATIAEFKAQQEASLKPYVAAINALKAAGAYTVDNPHAVEISEAYNALEAEINGKVHNKYSELLKEELTGVTSKVEMEKLKVAADRSFLSVAADVGGPDVLNALLVGQQTGDKFVRGPGADLLEAMFYTANPQGTPEQMQEWWTKHSSNEQNIRVLVKYAMALQDQMNMNKTIDKVREQTKQQVKHQQKFIKSTPQGGFRPKTTISSELQQVRAWAGDTV